MKHISKEKFLGTHDDGKYLLPTTMFRTYCHQTVLSYEIDDINADCEDCLDAKTWEIIDSLPSWRDNASTKTSSIPSR